MFITLALGLIRFEGRFFKTRKQLGGEPQKETFKIIFDLWRVLQTCYDCKGTLQVEAYLKSYLTMLSLASSYLS